VKRGSRSRREKSRIKVEVESKRGKEVEIESIRESKEDKGNRKRSREVRVIERGKES
jgi:hypothetical protein